MASVVGSSAISISLRPWQFQQVANGNSGFRTLSFSNLRKSLPSIHLQPARFQVSCADKRETVEKVCNIVKKQLALSDETSVTGESKFAALGADSLDTVEIVMAIEEAFGISVEEESAQSISTVQDAADMVEKLLEAKSD